MSNLIQLTGPNTLALAIPSSFVASAPDLESKESGPVVLADLWIGRGSWIIQAKATVRNANPTEALEVKFLLTVQGDSTAEDAALSSVKGGYATVALALGVHLASSGHVELGVSTQGLQIAAITRIVIVGIKEETVAMVKI